MSTPHMQSCLDKQNKVIELFKSCSTKEEIYAKIIELGKKTPPLEEKYKTEEARVVGCQSQMFICARCENDKIYFVVEADALISQGLATLLVEVYSGESPEVVLTCAPKHLETLGLKNLLTPSRSNGVVALYRRMQQEALKIIQGRCR